MLLTVSDCDVSVEPDTVDVWNLTEGQTRRRSDRSKFGLDNTCFAVLMIWKDRELNIILSLSSDSVTESQITTNT